MTDRSRGNLPNSLGLPANCYVPLNAPSISDLFDLFDFGQSFAPGRPPSAAGLRRDAGVEIKKPDPLSQRAGPSFA